MLSTPFDKHEKDFYSPNNQIIFPRFWTATNCFSIWGLLEPCTTNFFRKYLFL